MKKKNSLEKRQEALRLRARGSNVRKALEHQGVDLEKYAEKADLWLESALKQVKDKVTLVEYSVHMTGEEWEELERLKKGNKELLKDRKKKKGQKGQKKKPKKPILKTSLGELRIVMFLESTNIKYKRECSFPGLEGEHQPLRFDFYLPEHNVCIEFDGKQHFQHIDSMHGKGEKGKLAFRKGQKYDEFKNRYCIERDIKLIRIPYTHINNIPEVLNETLGLKST